jgi:alcohol dehydrogenase
VTGSRSIASRFGRTAIEVEDTLRFSALHKMEPMVEQVRLPSAEETYPKLMAGNAR